ncbi:Cytochrome P450 monooxygenase aclL [Colletotrichum siamense]|uniref:Cytochrome P450 monooxygenase aclL n=1 Tax=Colletotrichum siamense TaxID=690259 RepID=UPI0018727656|nr:Cytochrome P450 monooxygenase aclL [Colletotrichum siamense]KAF5484573.1 Cytochrome P450 monooxygenase aclL [Colletotrichum siamense]
MGSMWQLAVCAFVAYRLSIVLYNLFIHPLKSFPGPSHYAVSWLPKFYRQVYKADYWRHAKALHEKYGPVVRVGPNELSFSSAQALDDIYGVKTKGKLEFPKDAVFYDVRGTPLNDSMISADQPTHRALRRQVAPAFSEKALKAQEPIIQRYADMMISELRDRVQEDVDIVDWVTFATADVMADLSTGESLYCMEKGEMDPFVDMILNVSPFIGLLQLFNRLPLTRLLYKMVSSQKGLKTWLETVDIVAQKAEKREKMGNDRPDFMTMIWAENDDRESWTRDKIINFAQLLFFAGSETSATTLSVVMFHLLTTPHAYKRLTDEIRTIESDEEITISRLATMEYLTACIDEGMRMRPVVAAVIPRVGPPGGGMVDGHYIPEGTTVGVPQWATHHMDSNFFEANSYLPERWLKSSADDPRFAADQKGACQPFAKGPRNCLGKGFAYGMIRMFLAKLIWHFDIELKPEDRDWDVKPTFTSVVFWAKPKMHVKLTPVQR